MGVKFLKIGVASSGLGGLDDVVSPQFGRCRVLTIVEVEGTNIRNYRSVQNPGAISGGGAGIQAAQLLAQEGCEVVIAGNFGPNAFQVLIANGISPYTSPPVKVREAVEMFLRGELPEAVPRRGGGGMGKGMGRGRGWSRYP